MAQPDPSPPSSGSNTATLRLIRLSPDPLMLVQESRDASVLAGLSTVGGFWTVVNGGFVFLFGANVLYFIAGSRPLSALGALHIFQRRSLVRRWHEDFPAIRTEGGQPGSETAGIVAFIRERLVDLEEEEDEDIGSTSVADLEGQQTTYSDHQKSAISGRKDEDGSLWGTATPFDR
ncbi:hypothetical protein C8R44DRAFT_767209 [Mycena epipterygia]|nr:hypothetical protein C8R44DRAFT_767209 [Mycena epipterygia]